MANNCSGVPTVLQVAGGIGAGVGSEGLQLTNTIDNKMRVPIFLIEVFMFSVFLMFYILISKGQQNCYPFFTFLFSIY